MIKQEKVLKNLPEKGEKLYQGTVKRIIYTSPEGLYTVFLLKVEETGENIIVTGEPLSLEPGNYVSVRGEFVRHPKYGKQFSASSIVPVKPVTNEGIIRYLSSGIVKGIGKKLAAKIVDAFGVQTFEMIKKFPDKVAKVRGIGKKKALLLKEALEKEETVQKTLSFLLSHGLSLNLARKVFLRFKEKTIEIISENPYILAECLKGVGFITADRIAIGLGFEPASEKRIRGAVLYLLERAKDDGHCFLTKAELHNQLLALLGVEYVPDLEKQLERLQEEGVIVIEKECIYLTPLYKAEEGVARFISERVSEKGEKLSSEEIEKALNDTQKELGIQFNAAQRLAVRLSLSKKVTVITGGPGCGKTTLTRALVNLLKQRNKTIALCAPTGRAAQRLAQACSDKAKTIHRLLKYNPAVHSFYYGAGMPLRVNEKLIDYLIVDESSMIDITLAFHLVSALPSSAHVIFVGDANQLPPVGAGTFFMDLVSSGKVPTAVLTEVYRQAERSSIIRIAHEINAGIIPAIAVPDGKTKTDAYLIPRSRPEEILSTLKVLLTRQLREQFGFKTEDILVITPTNRGPLGTITLNRYLQTLLNPRSNSMSEPFLEVGSEKIFIGDKVYQKVNNYDIHPDGVFNGDTGQVIDIDAKEQSCTVKLWDGRVITYTSGSLNQLGLAYVITVHKSQGSEAPCVIVICSTAHYIMLEKQLMYTAVTRAKKFLLIIGSKKALITAVRRSKALKRNSRLSEKIKEFSTC
ncbi:MAG: ATP-dependent RecD-like DNA helicase [Candidatus Dadabacteria bacterium]|nr:MAG: ATP-dependent RecD-like DNA helicase [Candidatus Dadabacteria bacterium]